MSEVHVQKTPTQMIEFQQHDICFAEPIPSVIALQYGVLCNLNNQNINQ